MTGQINSCFIRPDKSLRQIGFQETDIVSIVEPITKYATMVTDPESIRYELEKALYLASLEAGPSVVGYTSNVQKQKLTEALLGFDTDIPDAEYDEVRIERKPTTSCRNR